MALRLGGLRDIDPTSVPLPQGTAVVTRVDREVDGEVRPLGATGRVSKLDGDRVEVTFVDGKHATYLRSEVTPRKHGVARYAQRRAAAWDRTALHRLRREPAAPLRRETDREARALRAAHDRHRPTPARPR